MSKKQNKYTTCIATKGSDKIYLSNKDIEKGLDIQLDMLGYEIVSI